jgi:crossover junction endodeoxyribonuclease RusA
MWVLKYEARPWTVNSERAGGARGIGGPRARADLTREWRTAFWALCLEQKIPPLQHVHIEALQVCRDKRMPDIGACYPAAKAAIDGLVDAGVIVDDNGQWVQGLTFVPPVALGYDALVLRIDGPIRAVAA